MSPPDRAPEPLSREEETAGFDTGTPEWETPPEADEDYLTPREWEAHVARLNEYAAMMPAEGWGWVTPRPGGRPATLEAAGQVIAHGIAFPAAEYLGLCDPTTIRRLIADRPLDAARDSRPVGEGLDVERLARALVYRRYGIRTGDANPADLADAAVIAREYRRLATNQPASPEAGERIPHG